jgi:hypothetical protein
LTDDQLRAIAYFSVGVGSEGKDVAYGLGFCGYIHHAADGATELEPIGNSGYAIGEMQTDLGSSDASISRALVDGFQDWAKLHHPHWALDEEQASRLAADLGRDGNHIRDPNYTAHDNAYKALHHDHSLSTSDQFPKTGADIDPAVKARLETYLRSDSGKAFVDRQDATQVRNLLQDVRGVLTGEPLYKNASSADQVKLFAVMAKVYNQGPAQANRIMRGIERHQIDSLADINRQIDTCPAYMRTGRQAALVGAEVFNALQRTAPSNPLHAVWQDVLANPVAETAKPGSDHAHPHLSDEYAVVKALFVQPAQGLALIEALEKGGSYNYGDPGHAHSRGFYAQGGDFLQWDRDGHGRAYMGGRWSQFSRNEVSVVQNRDHTIDVRLTRDGAGEPMLHLALGDIHRATAALLRPGSHGEAVADLQNDLRRLGYLGQADVDGDFGPMTASAVEHFQRDEGLVADGIVGDATRQKLGAGMQAREATAHGSDCAMPNVLPSFSDPAHPRHAMYSRLQALLPSGTSPERLHQATAACHMAGMRNPGDLAGIYGGGSSIVFTPRSMFGHAAAMDLGRPAPSVQQTLRQVQAFDQLQDRQAMQRPRQINPQRQGPVLGGL